MTNAHTPAALLQSEAINLAYTLAARAADLTGTRVLAIKGLVASTHNLRAHRTPADIDILIDPTGFDALLNQLRAWGWYPRPGDFDDTFWPHHSTTYIHDQWPCDIDAHHRFPGLLAPPQRVFDALWERRGYLPLAGRCVPMTDWATSVAIMAAHSARSSPDNPRHTDELRTLLTDSATWNHSQRAELANLAVTTGSAQSLEPIWRRVGVRIDTAEHVPADDLAEWQARQNGRLPSTRVWMRYIIAGGPRHALGRLRTALWLPEPQMRATRQIADGKLPLFTARLKRLLKTIRQAPEQLLSIARGGDNVTNAVVQDPGTKQ